MNPGGRALFSGMLLAAVFLFATISVHGADSAAGPTPPVATPVTDPAQVAERYHQVVGRPLFQESEQPAVNSQLKDWLSRWFNRLGATIGDFKYQGHMPAFESLLLTVLVVFSAAILLYIMVRLTRRRDGLERESDAGGPDSKTFRAPELYDAEIRQAVGAGDWHGAWLAAWRQFLSRLEHGHLVDADRTRTNREYLAQLRGRPLPGSALALLSGMVDAYDGSIYGGKSIGQTEWDHFHAQLNEAALLLHLEEKRSVASARAEAS